MPGRLETPSPLLGNEVAEVTAARHPLRNLSGHARLTLGCDMFAFFLLFSFLSF